MLPVRQSLGQFFSAFDIEVLVRGLDQVQVSFASEKHGEAAHLVAWLRSCLEDAAQRCGIDTLSTTFACNPFPEEKSIDLQIKWKYEDAQKAFCWRHSEPDNSALTSANFGQGHVEYTAAVKPLAPENALAEALFF